jgi:hypothetical protein
VKYWAGAWRDGVDPQGRMSMYVVLSP